MHSTASSVSQVRWDRYGLIINDERVVIRSGAMHYFRLPGEALWRQRLQQLKAAGYNTVDLYFNWDYHSDAPGHYDFSGFKNIDTLLAIVAELGLYLIARPGPYINAETARGGLPAWLFQQPDVQLRNRLSEVDHYSPVYMQHVEAWMDQILPRIAQCPMLIMVQIENEYGTESLDPRYFQELTAMVRRHGITVPTMHNDFYAFGLYSDEVDIYAIDNYCVTSFDHNWREQADVFAVVDGMEATIRPEFCENRPLMVAELQAGWFAQWDGPSYATIDQSLDRHHIGLITRSVLGQGCTLFNHYKAIGGTNWGHIGSSDVCTSYDFCSPISEMGLPTNRLLEAKQINQLLASFDLNQTERMDWAEAKHPAAKHPAAYALRRHVESDAHWLFARNLHPNTQLIPLTSGNMATIKPYEMVCLPENLPLTMGLTLKESTLEPLGSQTRALVFGFDRSGCFTLSGVNAYQADNLPEALSATCTEGILTVSLLTAMPDNSITSLSLTTEHGEILWLHGLGADMIDRYWRLTPDMALIGPDGLEALPGEQWRAHRHYDSSRHDTLPWAVLRADGSCQRLPSQALEGPPLSVMELTQWQYTPIPCPQPADMNPLATANATFAELNLPHGMLWLSQTVHQPIETIEIEAYHGITVVLNGHQIAKETQLVVPPETLADKERVFTVSVKQSQAQFEALPEQTNHITLLVESFGDHKGFYQDDRLPSGIVRFRVNGQDALMNARWSAGMQDDDGIAHIAEWVTGQTQGNDTSASSIWAASTTVTLAVPDSIQTSYGLVFDHGQFERIYMVLNGVLVGRYWSASQAQRIFYLPEGILTHQGANTIELVLIPGELVPESAASVEKLLGTIRLVPVAQYERRLFSSQELL